MGWAEVRELGQLNNSTDNQNNLARRLPFCNLSETLRDCSVASDYKVVIVWPDCLIYQKMLSELLYGEIRKFL